MSSLKSWINQNLHANEASRKILVAEKLEKNWMFEPILYNLFRVGLQSRNVDMQAFIESSENIEKIETPNTSFNSKVQYWAFFNEKFLGEAKSFVERNN